MAEIGFYHLLSTPLERALPRLYSAGVFQLRRAATRLCGLCDSSIGIGHPEIAYR